MDPSSFIPDPAGLQLTREPFHHPGPERSPVLHSLTSKIPITRLSSPLALCGLQQVPWGWGSSKVQPPIASWWGQWEVFTGSVVRPASARRARQSGDVNSL